MFLCKGSCRGTGASPTRNYLVLEGVFMGWIASMCVYVLQKTTCGIRPVRNWFDGVVI